MNDNNTPAAEGNEFAAIVEGLDLTVAPFTYKPLDVSESAPIAIRPNYKVRQWALVDGEGRIAAVGPTTGGGKSAFIAYAAEHPGYTVAHRWVELAGWVIPE